MMTRVALVFLAPFAVAEFGAHLQGKADGIDTVRCDVDFGVSVRADLYFLGQAHPDTVRVGEGDVTPVADVGPNGHGKRRDIFGQRVRITELNVDASLEVRRALDEAGSPDVVVVPWDYDAGCEPTYWRSSARWIEPGPEAFYVVRLRPRRHWAGNYPTFDAFFAALHPYPLGLALRARRRREHGPWLSPRELFSLYTVMPSWTEMRTSRLEALDRIEAWEVANPALARRYPANEAISITKEQLVSGR
jgi:hypothetical protein